MWTARPDKPSPNLRQSRALNKRALRTADAARGSPPHAGELERSARLPHQRSALPWVNSPISASIGRRSAGLARCAVSASQRRDAHRRRAVPINGSAWNLNRIKGRLYLEPFGAPPDSVPIQCGA